MTEAMAPDAPVALLALLALAGLVSAALLSAGEGALRRLTRATAADVAASGAPWAGAVVRLAEHTDRALLAVGFGRAVSQVVAAVGIALVTAASLAQWWHVLTVSVLVGALAVAVIVGVSPRSFGRRRPMAVLRFLGPGLLVLSTVAVPLERLEAWSRSGRTRREAEADAEAELREMVDRVSESERIEEDERELLHSVFELGRTLTREVMVPRTEMVTLPAGTSADRALRLFVRSGFSRVPVIGASTDDVLGVLYLKDLLRHLQDRPGAGEGDIAPVMREPVYVPETKAVDDLMREMQRSAHHIALAVDEYGGIAGLVTIEDCLEEIVGELRDEHDRAEPEVEQLGEGVFRVPARLGIEELGDLFEIDLEDDEVDTAGGLLAKALGKVPIPGATAAYGGLLLRAERTEGRRRQVSTLVVERAVPEVVLPAEAEAGPEPTEGGEPGTPEGSRPGEAGVAHAEPGGSGREHG